MWLINSVPLFTAIAERLGTSSLVAAAVASFGLSSLIYLSSGIVSRLAVSTYRSLTMVDQQRWNSGITRGILGLILALHGLRALVEGVPNGDIVDGTTEHLLHSASFALGFFIFETRDSLNMLLAHAVNEETLLQHHLLGIVLFASALYWQSYTFLAVGVLIQEFAAPFTHCGWVLTKCGLDQHWIWIVNQYLLIVVWILFRTISDMLMGYHIAVSLLIPPRRFLEGPVFPMLFCLGGFAMLSMYLNPFWLQTKFRQLDRRNARVAKARARQQQQPTTPRSKTSRAPSPELVTLDNVAREQTQHGSHHRQQTDGAGAGMVQGHPHSE